MGFRSTAFAGLICFSFGAAAQNSAPLTPDHAYSTSLFAQAASPECAKVWPEFQALFDQKFASWKRQNSELIAEGRGSAEAKLKPGDNIKQSEKRISGFMSIGLTTFPPAQLKARCELLLKDLDSAVTASGA